MKVFEGTSLRKTEEQKYLKKSIKNVEVDVVRCRGKLYTWSEGCYVNNMNTGFYV